MMGDRSPHDSSGSHLPPGYHHELWVLQSGVVCHPGGSLLNRGWRRSKNQRGSGRILCCCGGPALN